MISRTHEVPSRYLSPIPGVGRAMLCMRSLAKSHWTEMAKDVYVMWSGGELLNGHSFHLYGSIWRRVSAPCCPADQVKIGSINCWKQQAASHRYSCQLFKQQEEGILCCRGTATAGLSRGYRIRPIPRSTNVSFWPLLLCPSKDVSCGRIR